jgi:glycosyltransferase involved in cell wall biosynthesis
LQGTACQKEIRDLYAEADLYVAPATLESFGIAALEARCAGLPVVAYSGSGVADFITHGEDGFLADDDSAMVARISELCLSPGLRSDMTARLSETAPSIDWGCVLDATDQLYQRARALAWRPGRLAAPVELV